MNKKNLVVPYDATYDMLAEGANAAGVDRSTANEIYNAMIEEALRVGVAHFLEAEHG